MTREQLFELIGCAEDDLILHAKEGAVNEAEAGNPQAEAPVGETQAEADADGLWTEAEAFGGGQTAAPPIMPLPLELHAAERLHAAAGKRRAAQAAPVPPAPAEAIEVDAPAELSQKKPSVLRRVASAAAALALVLGVCVLIGQLMKKTQAPVSGARPHTALTEGSDELAAAKQKLFDFIPNWGSFRAKIFPDPMDSVEEAIAENDAAIAEARALLEQADPDKASKPGQEPETPLASGADTAELSAQIEALEKENRLLYLQACHAACENQWETLGGWTLQKIFDDRILFSLAPTWISRDWKLSDAGGDQSGVLTLTVGTSALSEPLEISFLVSRPEPGIWDFRPMASLISYEFSASCLQIPAGASPEG